ncbi:MAG: hypothetical protein ACPGQS_13150 [Bradymonadia bacterium]
MSSNFSTDAVTCCYSDCTTVLIETVNSVAITRADHTLCKSCRSIIICSPHFELLDKSGVPFLCPACNENAWQHVVSTAESQAKSDVEFQCIGVYEDIYSSTSSLTHHEIIITPTTSGSRIQAIDGSLTASAPGRVIDAALSPQRQHLAIIFQHGHECILEVHSDAGRPWRLRSDSPLGLCAIAFFDETRLAGLNCRQEGHLELIELSLESGHTIRTRRICTTSTQSDDSTPLQLTILDRERIITSGWSGESYWLDTIEMATGTKIRTTPIPYLPTFLRAGPNGHFLIGCLGGPVGLVKDDTHVELFKEYSLLDALFGEDGFLYLTSRTHGLKIDLQSGASHERAWERPVIGLKGLAKDR